MRVFQADTKVLEEKSASAPQVKPLAGEGVKVFLNFEMDRAVYGALRGAALREAVTVEQMTHRVLSHALGYEVPQ